VVHALLASPGYGTAGSTAAPLSIRTTEYDIDRKGLIGGLTVDLGSHEIGAGFWTEDNDFNQARRFYAETAAAPSRDPLDFQSNPFFTQWAVQLRDQDHDRPPRRRLDRHRRPEGQFRLQGHQGREQRQDHRRLAAGRQDRVQGQLPAAGRLRLQSHNDVECSAATPRTWPPSSRPPRPVPFASQNQAGRQLHRQDLEPESSKTIELGGAIYNERFQGVAAVYHVDFDNRLLAASTAAPILGLPAVLSNVGAVETKGDRTGRQYA
jgi:iron complex outermembrane receptor protein